jgi:hypothetical protein
MPQAKRSTSTSRSRAMFKQPPALKRLSTSLETAQRALSELRKDAGRDVGKGAKDLYGDLRTFVSNARRDSNRLAKALQREFDQAQKQLAKAAASSASTAGRSTSRSTSRRSSSSSRSTASRSSGSSSSGSRSSGSRSSGSSGSRSTGSRSSGSSGGSRASTTRSSNKRGSSGRGTGKS